MHALRIMRCAHSRGVFAPKAAAGQCELTRAGAVRGRAFETNGRRELRVGRRRYKRATLIAGGTMSQKQRILVCDDDEMLVDLLVYRLESRGFAVLVARDGGQALALAESDRPDAIVLDAMMPVMNGEQVLREFRSREANRSIPVIMLTARRQERDIVGALELGADDYLIKPFIPDELITRLKRLLEATR